MKLPELPQCHFSFLSHKEYGILAHDADIVTELLVNIGQRDVGRIVLENAHAWPARNCNRDMEVQIPLMSLLFPVQNTTVA